MASSNLESDLDATDVDGTQVKMHGIGSLFWGAFATAAATFVGTPPLPSPPFKC